MSKGKRIFIEIYIVVLIGLAVAVLLQPKYDYYGDYRQPYCHDCYATFISEVCETCGENIMDTGVLVSRSGDTLVAFEDVFDSYESYVSGRRIVVMESFAIMLVLLVGIVVAVMWHNKKGKD